MITDGKGLLNKYWYRLLIPTPCSFVRDQSVGSMFLASEMDDARAGGDDLDRVFEKAAEFDADIGKLAVHEGAVEAAMLQAVTKVSPQMLIVLWQVRHRIVLLASPLLASFQIHHLHIRLDVGVGRRYHKAEEGILPARDT
jgi:hypothetical protein